MEKALEELEQINGLISEDTDAAAAALKKFKERNHPIGNKYVAAKADLLSLIIASVFNKYEEAGIDDNKLVAYFEKEKKFDEAALVLLTKARHYFTNIKLAEGEVLLAYVREHLIDKISLRCEIVYLTRVAFLHGRRNEYDERMNVSLAALNKLKGTGERGPWFYNMYSIFTTNIAECYFRNSDFDKAWPYLEDALQIVEKENVTKYNKFNVYHYIAQYHLYTGDKGQSMAWHEKIINMLKDDATHHYYACQSYLVAAGEYYEQYRETAPAKKKLRLVLANKQAEYLSAVSKLIKDDVSSGHYQLLVLGKARLEFQRKNYKTALDYLDKLLPFYLKQNHHIAIIDCNRLLHDIYFEWGKETNDIKKLIKAHEYLQTASTMEIANSRQSNQQKLEAIRAKYELQQKQQQEKILQQQIEAMNKEVHLTALNLQEKISVLDELKEYIQSLRKKGPEGKDFVSAVSQKIGAIKITEQDKSLLQQKMDAGNAGFYKIISTKYPVLTSHEVQTCGLLKTGMTDKELSKLYGLSKRGYELLRYRIKKKMQLKPEENLVKHLIEIHTKASSLVN